MIGRQELLAFEFYKLRPFKGSDNGIRYMIQKETLQDEKSEDGEGKTVLTAYIWPEPFCFEATPEEKKGSKQFEFSEEGLCEAIEWLNRNHDAYEYKKEQ